MEVNSDKVEKAWRSLESDEERQAVEKGRFPHKICYFELNFAEHLELQRIAKRYFQTKKSRAN